MPMCGSRRSPPPRPSPQLSSAWWQPCLPGKIRIKAQATFPPVPASHPRSRRQCERLRPRPLPKPRRLPMSHHHPPSPPHGPDPAEVSELWLLREILWTLRESLAVQYEILSYVKPPNSTALQIGANMQQFDPGATGIVLQAAFTPTGSTAPNPGYSISWTDSNSFCTFANNVSDSSGLTQDVTVSTSATVGTSGVITATVTGTFPDGTNASISGQFSYTIGAAPVGNATGLSISRLA